jgi:hypothetical protein
MPFWAMLIEVLLLHACLTLLNLGLSTLEEVKGIGGLGVDVLHHREDVKDVLLCEGRLVATVKVILLYQDLENTGRQETQEAC